MEITLFLVANKVDFGEFGVDWKTTRKAVETEFKFGLKHDVDINFSNFVFGISCVY